MENRCQNNDCIIQTENSSYNQEEKDYNRCSYEDDLPVIIPLQEQNDSSNEEEDRFVD
jgi:hypothetical protein